MPKSKKNGPNCVLTLPLKIEKWQADQINRDMRVGCDIYNALRHKCMGRYLQMIRTREWKDLMARRPKDKTEGSITDWYKERLAIIKKWRLTEFDFYDDVSPMNLHYMGNVSATICQKIAQNLYRAFDVLLYGKGDKVAFCRYENFNSLEGKTNDSGIVYKDGNVRYGRKLYMTIPVRLDPNNAYEQKMLEHRVKYCRILRKWVRTKWKYYVQLILDGAAVIKTDAETGEVLHPLGSGRVGLCIGAQSVTAVTDSCVKVFELAPNVEDIERELRRINRAMDRSRRATNPHYFNEDGTIAKLPRIDGRRQKRHWVESNNYKRLAAKRKELFRKAAAVRKQDHEMLANEIMKLGSEFIVENVNYSLLQRKAKKPKKIKDAEGNIKPVEQTGFGKTIANRAPAAFIQILGNKVTAMGGHLYKVNAFDTKPFMPEDKNVDNELYTAFLLQNINDKLDGPNTEACDKKLPHFMEMHNEEIQRMGGPRVFSNIEVA